MCQRIRRKISAFFKKETVLWKPVFQFRSQHTEHNKRERHEGNERNIVGDQHTEEKTEPNQGQYQTAPASYPPQKLSGNAVKHTDFQGRRLLCVRESGGRYRHFLKRKPFCASRLYWRCFPCSLCRRIGTIRAISISLLFKQCCTGTSSMDTIPILIPALHSRISFIVFDSVILAGWPQPVGGGRGVYGAYVRKSGEKQK